MAVCKIEVGGGALLVGEGRFGGILGTPNKDSQLLQSWKRRPCLLTAGLEVHGGRSEQGDRSQLPSSFVRLKPLSELSKRGFGVPAKYVIEVAGRTWRKEQRGRQWGVVGIEASGSGSGRISSGRSNAGARSGARERRLQKAAEEKKRKTEGAQRKYPEWASILEDACKDDMELREIIGDSFGNPDEMRKRVEERVRRKGRNILSPKTGSAVQMAVTFRSDFDPTDSYIWLELYGDPSDGDVETIGNVLTSWYMLGKLGAFNSMNMQLTALPIDQKLSYSTERATEALPSVFHNILDLEFQDNWGRFWVDLGTSDPVAMDVLINTLSGVSSDHVGIKQLVFGGQKLGDWAEGLDDPEDGYKFFKI